MDITTAAKYLQLGYRIKRASWEYVAYAYGFAGNLFGFSKTGQYPFSLSLSPADLLADDWEVLTEGIVRNFPIIYSD